MGALAEIGKRIQYNTATIEDTIKLLNRLIVVRAYLVKNCECAEITGTIKCSACRKLEEIEDESDL